MEIKHEHLVHNGKFFIEDEQKRKLAVMTYVMRDEKTMVIEHTIVSEELEGHGVGRRLVEAGVNFARAQGYKIIPECPYAGSVFRKTPEYKDVLAD